MRRLALGVVALVSLSGCVGGQGDGGEPAGPAKVEFTGQVDSALAGTWRTKESDSILALGKDGSLQIDSTFNTPKGIQHATKHGSWLSDPDRLRLRYKEDNGQETTIAYSMKVSGNTMTLTTKVPKKDTVYTRK